MSKSAATNEAGGWTFSGLPNLFFLAVILGAVFVDQPTFLREGLMIAAAIGSYFTTKKSVHAANGFNFHPAIEVAVLFAGIFATMIPALAWLEHHAGSLLGQQPTPGTFYFGVRTPVCSAMDFTMKFGPLPMYVAAPKNTAPTLMAMTCAAWLASNV